MTYFRGVPGCVTKCDRGRGVKIGQNSVTYFMDGPYDCDKHENKPLEIYCSSCQEAVCALCLYKSHKTHNTLPVIEVITDFRRIIQENADAMMATFSHHLKQKATRKNSDKEMFVGKVAAVESEIKGVRQNLRRCTKKDCDSLLQQLNFIKQERIKVNERKPTM